MRKVSTTVSHGSSLLLTPKFIMGWKCQRGFAWKNFEINQSAKDFSSETNRCVC